MPPKDGDTVTVEYTGTFDDGTVFDSSEKHDKPLEFKIGSKMVIPGFENAIKEMEKGDEKQIKLEPKDTLPKWTYCPSCNKSIQIDNP